MDRDHGGGSSMHGSDDSKSRKGRLMGKLFGARDRKASNEQGDAAGINDFLHGAPGAGNTSRSNSNYSTISASVGPTFDSFQIAHPAPPSLAKIDTRSAPRYPNALPVDQLTGAKQSSQQSLVSSQMSRSKTVSYSTTRAAARRNRKGLTVRFTDAYPEIMGEGGDESEIPASEIGRQRRANMLKKPVSPMFMDRGRPQGDAQQTTLARRPSLPGPSPQRPPHPQQSYFAPQHAQPQPALKQPQPQPKQWLPQVAHDDSDFTPRALKRTQTGFSSISAPSSEDGEVPHSPSPPSFPSSPERKPSSTAPSASGSLLAAPSLSRNDSRRSFIEIHQAEMREAEGLALANALRAGISPPSSPEDEQRNRASPSRWSPSKRTSLPLHPPPRHPQHQVAPGPADSPPSQPPPAYSPERTRSRATPTHDDSPSRLSMSSVYEDSPVSPKPVASLRDIVQSVSDDSLSSFVARTRHLFELFRLHSETIKPLLASAPEDLARVALWWFTIGRMALENTMRDRAATTPENRQARDKELAMQQAYADLAKSYWISEEVLPEILSRRQGPVDSEVGQVRSVVVSNLRKLSMSMKRNDLLPPEDAFLPQLIDKAIWAPYPPVSSDVTALLRGYWGSSLAASASLAPPMSILESVPLSDNAQDFVFSRIWADVYLMEQGLDSAPQQQRLHFPCLLSVVRPQMLPTPEAIITSQNGTVMMRIMGKKNSGPTWEEVRWHPESCSLELRMPRGFLAVVQLSSTDYGLLWSMYDFGAKVHGQLYPRKDEHALFRSTLKAFQYFESGPPTGSFPKEAVPDCEVALFEKILSEPAATGRRNYHRGCRLAMVSGPRTRTLYGTSQAYPPDTPVQFSFLRGDHGDPALLLRYENNRSKGRMVLSFSTEEERMRFHDLIAGTALQRDERVVTEVPVQSLQVVAAATASRGNGPGSAALAAFQKLTFNKLRVVNYDDEADDTHAPTVLAESLRMVFDFGDCTMTDRINVAPGELKVRLDVRDNKCMAVLRQAQQDLTVAVSDVQVAREMGRELTEALRSVATTPTCRVLRFPTQADLHAVQLAITGYRVVYDGTATTFAIARRRMVVPIHKKWEAGTTRIQIVIQPDTKVTQLLAFFQDFHYGQSMSFVLKGTDVFESFGRGNKLGIKIDDAKFPLPRMPSGDSAGDGKVSGAEWHETAFVCLDMPDLPGEHDDISILFDKEAERDRFASCLPAAVRGSRLAKMF